MSSEILLNTIRNVIAIDRATSAFSSGLRVGQTVYLSDPDAERTLKLTGFSRPESGGRWTDGATASISLKLAPDSAGIARLRLHMIPFVTQTEGQTLRLRCEKGGEQVAHFSPGAPAWTTVDLPLEETRPAALTRIQIEVGQTFVPSKLGMGPDPRALGVMIRHIELLAEAVAERVKDKAGERTSESPTLSSPPAGGLMPLMLGSTISLASPDSERMVRLAGFSGLEREGRWTDGDSATVTIRIGNHAGKARLRLHFTPFVTSRTGQSIRVKCGDGPELARFYWPGPRCKTALDVPLSQMQDGGNVSISIKIDQANSLAAVGPGADERRLGIQLHRVELIAGFSHFRSTARWAVRALINRARRIVFRQREILFRPIVERLAHLNQQILAHGDALRAMTSDLLVRERSVTERLDALKADLARLNSEGLVKQATQLDVLKADLARLTKQATQIDSVARAIEDLPNRSEFEATGTRLSSLDQASAKLEQLIVALHEKTDVVANRFLLPVDDDTVLVRSFVGYLYCSRNDHNVLTSLAEGGGFEPGLRRLLERMLQPGMIFLDVGAHLGLHTLAAAKRVGNSGHVFSFEPTPRTYQLLSRTLRLNGFDDRVTARCAAAGKEDMAKPLYVSTISSHNSLYLLPGAETTVEVEIVQLNNELLPGQRIDIAKIDVEGAELDVLCGMSRVIAENPGILIIAEYGPSHLARTGVTPKDWLSAFSSQGFGGYVIEEPSGNCVPIEQVDLSDVFSVNIAFIRPTSPLYSRLSASAPAQTPVVVIGAGGHAKVVVELIRAQGHYHVMGCTDREPQRRDVVGAPILGSDDVLPDLYRQGIRHCFIALGDNALRRKVATHVTALGFELVNAISPKAIVSPTARLGRGVAVMAGAVINADATVGDLAIVNTRAAIDHDCHIGEAAHVAPRAALAGGVRIGPLAFVGAGAAIIPGISIGESTVIGAGATVISNLGPNLVAVGVPAKPLQPSSEEQQVDHGEQS